MKNVIFIKPLIFLLFMLGFGSCEAQVSSGAFSVLLKSKIKKTVPVVYVGDLAKKNLNDYTVLDAREKREYEVSHLKNAQWVGFDDFDISRLKGIKKDDPIVIYCSIGVRSEKIGEKLQAAGYTNVKNLYGSIFEWVNQGNTVYDRSGQATPKVHAYNKTWGVWLKKGEKVY